MLELKQTKLFSFQAQQIVSIGITACRVNCVYQVVLALLPLLHQTHIFCYMKNTLILLVDIRVQCFLVLLSTSYTRVCGPVQPKIVPNLEVCGLTFRVEVVTI